MHIAERPLEYESLGNDEEDDAENDSNVVTDDETRIRRVPCSVNGCTSKRNLEYKYCAKHLERKRKTSI